MSFYSTGSQKCKNKQVNKQNKRKTNKNPTPKQNQNQQTVEIRFLIVWQSFQVLLATKHKKYTLGYNMSGGISPGKKNGSDALLTPFSLSSYSGSWWSCYKVVVLVFQLQTWHPLLSTLPLALIRAGREEGMYTLQKRPVSQIRYMTSGLPLLLLLPVHFCIDSPLH